MKIAILGSGNVAKTLGTGLRRKGHEIVLGTRDIARLAGWAEETGVRVTSVATAAAEGDLVILAVKGLAAIDVARVAASGLADKTVIDACNPIADEPPVHGVFRVFTGPNASLMEALQAEVPAARFVKAFNSIGSAHMVDPQFAGGPPTMFIAGNDEGAKAAVTTLLNELGWETADMGRAESARAIEPLCLLWCLPGLLRNDWSHAFKLVHATRR